ncbi:hypothetical protein K402DRAFT_6777 [Aulographum hederae CBS 113979]|uniref:Uncharacterized protein n=1 Tax=Aulographum hederae CBS 113979 TaxID=1176131 RepID=A0A6G1HHF5_9PEZI|nr:hypothetical protein K402DRAFT_6777 [Aulographum hederae CBS 113979]
MAHLLSLSAELIHEIISYIPNPSELSNLSMTCTELNIFAIPYLYHKVVIDIRKGDQILAFARSLQGASYGHIRFLIFVDNRCPSIGDAGIFRKGEDSIRRGRDLNSFDRFGSELAMRFIFYQLQPDSLHGFG